MRVVLFQPRGFQHDLISHSAESQISKNGAEIAKETFGNNIFRTVDEVVSTIRAKQLFLDNVT